MTISKSQLVAEWVEAKDKFDRYKKLENELRVKVVETFFPTGGEGSHKVDFRGIEVKATIKYNYRLDQKELEELEDDFSDGEAACIKRKPSLDLTKYRALGDENDVSLSDCIIITPGLPSLAIKEW
tara:strand:- start:547 stop:924 length:378 start_codon:yes stop_codon:yes gene_type:complete